VIGWRYIVRLAPPTLALALALAGCGPAQDPPPAPSGLCDSFWGPAPATGRVHVDASAAEGGDGQEATPFSALADGLAAARATGVRSIVLAPGEYPGRYELSETNPEWLDSDIDIGGCGRDQTRLVGVELEEDLGGVRLQPVFDIFGEATSGVRVHDLAVVGGRRGVIIQLGAGADGPIVLERVDVLDSVRLGVLVSGASTVAHLLDVRVEGVEAELGQHGWGIAVQTGAWAAADLPEPTVIEDAVVTEVEGIGVLAHSGWVEITNTEVRDVAKVDGMLGRGVQLQQWTRATLDGVVVSGASDASVFLESPGRGEDPVEVFDCVLGPTLEAALPDLPDDTAADGLVAVQAAGEPSAASDFQVVVDGTELSGNPRVHVLADAVTLSVGPDNVFGKGAGLPLVSQGAAVVQGIGGGEPGHPVQELGPEDALEVNRQLPELDDPSEE